MAKRARDRAPPARFKPAYAVIAVATLIGESASAQPTDTLRAPRGPAVPTGSGTAEIVVTGERGSAVTTVEPLATFSADSVAAAGATSISEFLRTIRAVTQAADGSEPIFLLNSHRVSGYQEIGTLPPDAIEKVEVLPEQVALKFGYPPTRRVVNFITKRRFRQIELSAAAGSTTRSVSTTEKANASVTHLHNDARVTLALEYRHTDAMLQSERRIAPDPDILFDGLGNVTAANGGEIDPALSALSGRLVTVAPVPVSPADRSLSGFAVGANQPRLFDLGPYRTLVPQNDAFKAEAVIAHPIGKSLFASISLSAEQSRDRTMAGPASAIFTVPASNPFSPFAAPVLLNRYLVEADPLRLQQTMTTLHAGIALRGGIGGWRWDFSAAVDQQQISGFSERGVDLDAANAAIASGANPFAPLDESLLATRLVDRAQLRTRTASAKSVVSNTPIHLPAGEVTITATVEAERSTASSSTRGPNPFDLQLGRTRGEAGIAIDVPIASRPDNVLAFLGKLSVNASVNGREVSGFGSLHDLTYGLAWAPFEGVQLLATAKRSETAPAIAQLSTPVVRLTNASIFDFGTGRTELVTLIRGGNPDLLAETRRVRSIALNVKPFAKRELRLSATYEAMTVRNQTGTVYTLTPRTEAILPELYTRDSAGRLVSVAYRPINFARERRRTLNLTIASYGAVGKAPPAPAAAGKPPDRANYWAGIGPSFKFSDRLLLRAGAPEFDVLSGDTITGGGQPRVYGYAYGGINHLGNGLNFNAWYGGANRVRSGSNPALDLRFSPIFKLNLGGTLSVHHFLSHEEWTRHLQLKLDIENVGDAHQRVRDGKGEVPNRLQPDYLDPIGRTLTLTLRKLF